MTPETARFILLGVTAIVIMVLGYAAIWMVRRTRNVTQQRARKGQAARRRVDAAIERHELSQSTISVPDRFEALVSETTGQGSERADLVLTAEPQAGDLSSSMIVPQPPFDVTDQAMWQRWEATSDRRRRRATMLAGYLAHPLPRVRVEALELLASNQVDDPRFAQRIALLLLEDDRALRTRAARMAWGDGRLPAVVAALHERAPGAGGDGVDLSREYSEIENAAPRDEGLSLPRAFADRHTGDREEAVVVAELVELYAPDRAADRESVSGLGERLDTRGADARERGLAALTAARGRAAAVDAAERWATTGA